MTPSAPIRGHSVPHLAQGFARERPVRNVRIEGRKPGFADGFFQIYFVGIPGSQRTLTPDPWAEEGLKSRENRLHHGLGGSLRARKEFLQAPEPFLDAFDGSGIR